MDKEGVFGPVKEQLETMWAKMMVAQLQADEIAAGLIEIAEYDDRGKPTRIRLTPKGESLLHDTEGWNRAMGYTDEELAELRAMDAAFEEFKAMGYTDDELEEGEGCRS